MHAIPPIVRGQGIFKFVVAKACTDCVDFVAGRREILGDIRRVNRRARLVGPVKPI